MQSILVIRLSSLGDVILSTPIVRQLQHTYPNAIIDVAVAKRFAEVYAHNPRVRCVWSADEAAADATDVHSDDFKLDIKESLPRGRYDLIVDLQRNLRSEALRHGLGNEVVQYPKHRIEKLKLVYLKQKPAVITPIVERYRAAIAHLPLAFDTAGPEVWLPEERASGSYAPDSRRHAGSDAGSDARRVRVAIAPGAHHGTKRWPVSKFAALCSQLTSHYSVVTLVGGPADVPICNAVAEASGVQVQRADGATSLEQTIRVLDASHVLITNDSGVMHLGAARRIPTVAIFGSTVKDFGFSPYGTPFTIVEHDVECRPCSHIGKASCPKGHFLCMESIEPVTVMNAVRKFASLQGETT